MSTGQRVVSTVMQGADRRIDKDDAIPHSAASRAGRRFEFGVSKFRQTAIYTQ
jgi:hypothetical protein